MGVFRAVEIVMGGTNAIAEMRDEFDFMRRFICESIATEFKPEIAKLLLECTDEELNRYIENAAARFIVSPDIIGEPSNHNYAAAKAAERQS